MLTQRSADRFKHKVGDWAAISESPDIPDFTFLCGQANGITSDLNRFLKNVLQCAVSFEVQLCYWTQDDVHY